MSLLLQQKDKLIAFLIPTLLISTIVLLVKSSFYESTLAKYIIIDFLITIPLFYFLLVRKTTITNKTVLTLAVLGVFIASSILPTEDQGFLSTIKLFLLPVLEIGILSFIIVKSVKAYKSYKTQNETSLDFYDAILNVCNDIFSPRIGHLVATEFSMLYYSLFNWKKYHLKENEFSYHKNSTSTSVLLGFLLVVLVEAFVTHAMIKSGNTKSSIILAILSAYTFLQIVSVIRSLSKRPIFIDVANKQLVLRFGLLSTAEIPFELIKEIEVTNKELPEKTTVQYFSPLGNMADHNIILHLKDTINYPVFYGFKRKAETLAIFIDEQHKFSETLEKALLPTFSEH